MVYRVATPADAPQIAFLNQRLIQDEHHGNPMSLTELEQRMAKWLEGEYQAIVFEDSGILCGYALFKSEPDHIYLRHFYIDRDHRRQGVGRAAIDWLCRHWHDSQSVRLNVLLWNEAGIAFWRAMGFSECRRAATYYEDSLTLEKDC